MDVAAAVDSGLRQQDAGYNVEHMQRLPRPVEEGGKEEPEIGDWVMPTPPEMSKRGLVRTYWPREEAAVFPFQQLKWPEKVEATEHMD